MDDIKAIELLTEGLELTWNEMATLTDALRLHTSGPRS